MRTKLILLNSRILVLAIWIAAIFVNPALAYDLKEYYPLSQGNRWTYSLMEDEGVTQYTARIKGREIINGITTTKMFYGNDDYECIFLDAEGVKMNKAFYDDEYEIDTPSSIMFPKVKLGESRECSITATFFNIIKGKEIGKANIVDKITLESVEDVEVPAGKFAGCLKFSSISESKNPDGSTDKDICTIWLAPGVGRVKENLVHYKGQR